MMPQRVSAPGENIVRCFFHPLTLIDGCLPPDRLQYAEPDENSSKMQSFPIGTEVLYVCRPGYMKIPGKSATRTCEEGFQWSPIEQFCTGNVCMGSFTFPRC